MRLYKYHGKVWTEFRDHMNGYVEIIRTAPNDDPQLPDSLGLAVLETNFVHVSDLQEVANV